MISKTMIAQTTVMAYHSGAVGFGRRIIDRFIELPRNWGLSC